MWGSEVHQETVQLVNIVSFGCKETGAYGRSPADWSSTLTSGMSSSDGALAASAFGSSLCEMAH